MQACITVNTQWGEGHYRVMIDGTNDRFLDVSGNNLESRNALMFNFDQTLGNVFGAFLRRGAVATQPSRPARPRGRSRLGFRRSRRV